MSKPPDRALPGAYYEKKSESFMRAVRGSACICGRYILGVVMNRDGTASAFVHPQKPNGQPDICRL